MNTNALLVSSVFLALLHVIHLLLIPLENGDPALKVITVPKEPVFLFLAQLVHSRTKNAQSMQITAWFAPLVTFALHRVSQHQVHQ